MHRSQHPRPFLWRGTVSAAQSSNTWRPSLINSASRREFQAERLSCRASDRALSTIFILPPQRGNGEQTARKLREQDDGFEACRKPTETISRPIQCRPTWCRPIISTVLTHRLPKGRVGDYAESHSGLPPQTVFSGSERTWARFSPQIMRGIMRAVGAIMRSPNMDRRF